MASSRQTFFCILLLLVLTVVKSSDDLDWASAGRRLGDDMSVEFGSSIPRRSLDSTGYISYDALQADTVPCSVRGASYYNCQPGAAANPYTRGCSAITQCRG